MTTTLHPTADVAWADYLDRFHAERPGITERVLRRCRADGLDPYQWCAQPLAGVRGPVMDVACGSGPMADQLAGWIGSDTSVAELGAARHRHRGPLVRASATSLPVRSGAFEGLVCSMGMQIIDPLDAALVEVARALRPGGTAVFLVPDSRPMPWRAALLFAQLQIAVRRRIRYPNHRLIGPTALRRRAGRVGLTVIADERRPFRLALTSDADAEEFVASLYLPKVAADRLDAGRRLVIRRVGSELTVPLRRVILDRVSPPA